MLNLEEENKQLKLRLQENEKVLKKHLRISKVANRKQDELLKKIEEQRYAIRVLLDAQEQIIITTNNSGIIDANRAFFNFFKVDTIDEFEKNYNTNCICNFFKDDKSGEYLKSNMNGISWIDHLIINDANTIKKVIIEFDNKEYVFSVNAVKLPVKDEFISVTFSNITELEQSKKEVEISHKHTRDSIEYASLIQGALIPDDKEIIKFFKDHFVHWEPKDTVGGDIWSFNQLRHEDECLLFFIDCTGHGVPGAFVTMIVKAIEREIISKLKKHPEFDISPAVIMSYFNITMKKLLKQESKDSLSNAGWDGGIIYYNRRSQILKFAGAETPLFYTTKDGEFKTIKGNRYSVGYKKCDPNYSYKETILEVEEGMKFFCTTDGYLDQNGGDKDFPFGKKRFGNIIKENYTKSMSQLQSIFYMQMRQWEKAIPNNDRNDDMTVIAFEIDKKSDYIEDIVEEIIKYEGVMTQNVIATAMDNIEAKITNISLIGTISTIVIEYCQNMMNYSKNDKIGSRDIVPAGIIEVQCIDNIYYNIIATNIISVEDKEKIKPKLQEIQSLDKVAIKKRYRELRKSGANTHAKGGGIGIYEIAKVSDEIDYTFTSINEEKYYFTMRSIVNIKKD